MLVDINDCIFVIKPKLDKLEKEGIISRVKGYNGKRGLSLLESKIDNQLPLLGVVAAGMPIETYDYNLRLW